jgi:hypothetical protein
LKLFPLGQKNPPRWQRPFIKKLFLGLAYLECSRIMDQINLTGHPCSPQAMGINITYIQLRPQSSGKVESANQTNDCYPRITLAKLSQESSIKWTQLLPIALLRIRNAPRANIYLRPFEVLYGRPFLSNDLVTDPETDSLLKYKMDVGTFQRQSRSWETRSYQTQQKRENSNQENWC